MLILGALILGAFLCYASFGFLLLSGFSDQGRWAFWLIAAATGIPGGWMIVWAIIQIVILS